MQNPFLLIVEAADFVFRSVLNVYASFVLLIVCFGMLSWIMAHLAARLFSMRWPKAFIRTFTITGAFTATLIAQRVLYHVPLWLR